MSVCTYNGMSFVIYRDVVMDNKHKKNNSYEKVSYNFDDGARIGVRHIL